MNMYKCILVFFAYFNQNSMSCAIFFILFNFISGEGGGILLPPHTCVVSLFLFVANWPKNTTAPYKKALNELFQCFVSG